MHKNFDSNQGGGGGFTRFQHFTVTLYSVNYGILYTFRYSEPVNIIIYNHKNFAYQR